MSEYICLYCNSVITKGLGQHIQYCRALPTPAALGEMLRADENLSVNSLANQLGSSWKNVYRKLLAPGSGWTKEELEKRGKKTHRASACRDKMKACPHCGKKIRRGKSFKEHVARCQTLPSAREIADALNADPSLAITAVAKKYGVHTRRIKAILLAGDTNWSEEDLEARSHDACAAAARKRFGKKPRSVYRCFNQGCTIIVKRFGDVCQFCELDNQGIRTYHQFADYAYAQRLNGSEVLKRYLDT